MKNYIIAAALCCAANTMNAQVVIDESNFGGLTPEVLENSNREFGAQTDAVKVARYNYTEAIKAKGAFQEEVVAHVGNNLEPLRLYDADINGTWLSIEGIGEYFAKNFTGGVGLAGGHDYRKWEWSIGANAVFGKPAKESDDQTKFWRGRVFGELGFKVWQSDTHYSDFSVGIGYSAQVSDYFEKDEMSWSGKQTNEDGSVTTKTTTRSDLHNKQLTSGGYGWMKYRHRGAFKATGWYIKGSVGCQQDILMNTNRYELEVRATLGFELRLFKHGKYNHEGMKYAGYTITDVQNMMHAPYQTPNK